MMINFRHTFKKAIGPVLSTHLYLLENVQRTIVGHLIILYCHLPMKSMICGIQYRTGRLCGKCIDGYCITINRRDYKCTNSTHKYNRPWAILIATEYVPSTVLLVTILFYNINLHPESLGAIVMYFQVYSSLNMYSSGEINAPNDDLDDIIDFLYNIWNLEYIGT